MAKIRVYELARDLNMGNKELIEKLSAMDISVKSHMSSLDEETLARIKTGLLGKKVEEVEETRVRPTVIRRRRRAVVREVPAEEPAILEEETREDAEIVAAPEEDDVPVEETQEVETVAADLENDSIEADVSEASTAEVSDDIDESVESDVAEELPAPADEEVADAEEAASVAPETDSAASDEPEELSAESVPSDNMENAEAVDETADEPEAPAVEVKDVAQEAPAAPKEKSVPPVQIAKRIAKASKKDTPAKIVKLPDADEVLSRIQRSKAKPTKPAPVPAEGKGDAEVIALDREVPAEPSKKEKKRKGKGRGRGPEENDQRTSKRKTSFRKKAVVEGADLYDRSQRSRKGRKGAKSKSAIAPQKTQITTAKAIKRRIKIDDAIVLSELAKRMGIKANELIRTLMGMGVMATVNQTVDFDTATLVAGEFGYEVGRAAFEEDIVLNVEQDDPDKLEPRSPVVTIMGHVDHGKTSLLDVIRKTRITEMEAGGITQHIGAYSVDTPKGRITFLDTPGHEAFTSMRSRGAKVTDIVVLVVAADDGVMPQTVEAINHSKAAEVPIIVAINKIDKANADPARVQRELAENGLVPEDWGGDTIYVEVSAKQNVNIDDLLEMILLQAEVLELKANPHKLARGHVVEAKLDSGRGPVATVLVQEGTLETGQSIVCGLHHGRIRALLDHRGQNVASAGPSDPVEVIGLTGVPDAGDELVTVADERDAKQVSQHRIQKQRAKELAKSNRLSLDNLFDQIKEGQIKELSLIVKADVHGSIEALRDSLVNLSNDEVKINVIHAATGAISESDVSLAAVSDAIIIGFNVRPTGKVQVMAQEENVDVRYYNVIYNVIKDVKDAIVGMMDSTFEERVLGAAEVRQVFHIPKVGTIAGCYVTDGKIERGRLLRLVRDGVVQYEGKNSSLRRYKDDAKEVASGYECGIGIENYNDIKVGDVIECYYLEEIKPELD